MVSWLVDISPASRCANIETMTRNARVTIAAVIGGWTPGDVANEVFPEIF